MELSISQVSSGEILVVFELSINDYHKNDSITTIIDNPFDKNTFNSLLYEKNWIDTVQWHCEDIIRDPELDPKSALLVKHNIDKLNQKRTNIVEKIDDCYWQLFSNSFNNNSRLNTESPAWAIDRLSILCIKIWHMKEHLSKINEKDKYFDTYKEKLYVLLDQKKDLLLAYNQLIEGMQYGKVRFKIYRQMKMYNNPDTNPFLKGKEYT